MQKFNWTIGVSKTKDESQSAQETSSKSVDDRSTTSLSPDVVASKIPEESSVLLISPVRDNIQSEIDVEVVKNEAPPIVDATVIPKLRKKVLDTAKNHTKNVSSSVLLSNGMMMSLTLLRMNTMALQKMTFSKANVIEPATYSFQPTQLQDMGDFGNSPNLFKRSNTGGGNEQSKNESSNLQDKKQDLENESLSYKGTDNFWCQSAEDVSFNKEQTNIVCPKFPVKESVRPEVDREKEPPDTVPMKNSFYGQLSSHPFQETSYNPNYSTLALYPSKNFTPSTQEVNYAPFNVYKKSPMPEELAGLAGDGYKSIGMLQPLSFVKLSIPHNPQVGNLLLPIEATTHPPTSIAMNRTHTVLLESAFLAFGTLVESQILSELDLKDELLLM